MPQCGPYEQIPLWTWKGCPLKLRTVSEVSMIKWPGSFPEQGGQVTWATVTKYDEVNFQERSVIVGLKKLADAAEYVETMKARHSI